MLCLGIPLSLESDTESNMVKARKILKDNILIDGYLKFDFDKTITVD